MAWKAVTELIDVNVVPFLPEPLLSPQGLDRIRPISALIRASETFHFGFECRLYAPEPLADFGVCFAVPSDGPGPLEAVLKRLGETGGDQAVVNRIRDCVYRWTNAMCPHPGEINTWLEFDLIAPELPPLAHPNFFFAVPRAFWENGDECDHSLLSESLRILANETDSSVDTTTLAKLRSLAPEGSRIFELGALTGRKSKGIRVGIRSIQTADIVPYLQKIDWPGDVRYVTTILEELNATTDRVDIGLDVCKGVLNDSLGIECYFRPKESDRNAKSQWHAFGDFLCNNGLGLREKVESLGFFPGIVANGSRVSVPSQLGEEGQRKTERFELSIYHVKVSISGDVGKAKAYLSALRLPRGNRRVEV